MSNIEKMKKKVKYQMLDDQQIDNEKTEETETINKSFNHN